MSLKNQYDDFLKRGGGNKTLIPPTKNTMGYQNYMIPPNKTVASEPIVNTNFGTPVVNTQTTPSSTPSANPVVNPSSNTTPNVSPSVNPTPSINANSTNLWDLYSKQLAQSSINQKAELAAINERANQYTNAYLKSLGLQGTNAGATQIAQNNANLMNAYREIDANQQAALREYEEENKATNEDRIYEVYETALSNPNLTKEQIDDIITNFDPNISTQDYVKYINDLVMADGTENNSVNWEETRDNFIKELTKVVENKSGTNNERMRDFAKAKSTITKLKNAKTKAEVDAIIKEYNSNTK